MLAFVVRTLLQRCDDVQILEGGHITLHFPVGRKLATAREQTQEPEAIEHEQRNL